MKRNGISFWIGAALFLAAALLMTQVIGNQYPFFAGYVILQFIVLAVAWSILGGYAGYVNFGTSAFFGMGVYTAVFLFKAVGAPLAVQIAAAAVVGALMGFALGLLTLRMQGIFFSIATIALTIIIETAITNWRFVGGAAGIQLQRPPVMAPFDNYVQMLFFVQALLVVLAVAISRYIQNSWIGRGLQALKDDELAAECTGVPTLRLKLLACVISGALMCAAGAPAAMYLQYADPSSAFNLNYSVSALAMSLIGGTAHWAGPVIGAILLGTTQQLLTVTISSEVNVLVLGVMLVLFVVAAPEGIIGLVRRFAAIARRAKDDGPRNPGPPAADIRADQALRRLHRARQCQRRYPSGRALRPDRPERLGKDDADQLHFRRVPHRGRHRGVPRRGHHAAAAAYAHAARHRAQLPDPAAVQEHDGRRKPHGRARLCGGHRRIVSAAQRRDTMMSILTRMGLASKADVSATKLSQVELRKMELARAMATHPKLLISDEAMAGLSSSEVDEVLDLLMSLARPGHHHHHDRAHHAGGDAFLGARDVSRRRQDHRDRHAGRSHGQPARAGGLSWHLASPSTTSMRVTAP